MERFWKTESTARQGRKGVLYSSSKHYPSAPRRKETEPAPYTSTNIAEWYIRSCPIPQTKKHASRPPAVSPTEKQALHSVVQRSPKKQNAKCCVSQTFSQSQVSIVVSQQKSIKTKRTRISSLSQDMAKGYFLFLFLNL
jgi:hypothetical protein